VGNCPGCVDASRLRSRPTTQALNGLTVRRSPNRLPE
jgi:hypothetical protein